MGGLNPPEVVPNRASFAFPAPAAIAPSAPRTAGPELCLLGRAPGIFRHCSSFVEQQHPPSLQLAPGLRCFLLLQTSITATLHWQEGDGNPLVKNFLMFYTAPGERPVALLITAILGVAAARALHERLLLSSARGWGWHRGQGAAVAEPRSRGRGVATGRSLSSVCSPSASHSMALQIRGMQRRSWWKESDLNNAAENSAARLVFIILLFQ